MTDNSFLYNIINSSATKIPEKLFKSKYLPLLFYKDPYVFNITWITEIAESPHVRVFVTDDKDPNKVLFSIPPLREDLLHSKDHNLMASLALIKAQINVNGMGGMIELTNKLPTLIGIKPSDNKVYENEWRLILDRYGLSFFYDNDSDKKTTLTDNALSESDCLDDW